MSEQLQNNDELNRSKALLIYLCLASVEGLLAFVVTLLSPSDLENRVFLRYSTSRLMIAAGLLVLLVFFISLTVKSFIDKRWLTRLANWLLQKKTTIPYLLVGLFIGCLAILGIVSIYLPAPIQKPIPGQLGRLYPAFVWMFLLVVQLIGLWAWFWTSRKISVSTKTLDWALAGLLFVIALVPRTILTGYGLPYQSIWDEVVTYPQALSMFTVPGLRPYSNVPAYGHASYGDFLVYLTTGGEVLGLLDGFRTRQIGSIQEYVSPPQGVSSIFDAVDESGIPLRYPRLILALINSIAPVLIFFGLRRYLNADIFSAFGGGLLYALLSREVLYYSSYILPDALATTLFLGMLLLAWTCITDEDGRVWPYFLCSFVGGLILSTNLRLLTVAFFPFLALALARQRQRLPLKLLSIPAGLLFGFFITSPYTLIDLPNSLVKWTSFAWNHDLSLSHRLSSVIYYLQGIFQPGFNSSYIDTNEGSIGFGILAGVVALVGLGTLLVRKPRYTALILIFTAIQLYSITPITERYTRHALVFYPLACIAAGMGLSLLGDGIKEGIKQLRKNRAIPILEKPLFLNLTNSTGMAAIVLVVFLAFNYNQFSYTFTYLRRATEYKTSQMKTAEYLSELLKPGEKVGILDILPWDESDLQRRHINYERISLSDTPESLAGRGIQYVAGTDRIGGMYGTTAGTMWENTFSAPGLKLAEFGGSNLEYQGNPTNNLYIFVARLPGSK